MQKNNSLLYNQSFSIKINSSLDPLFYYFDYDERIYNYHMDFQHFHSFYEIYILLEGKATLIIDGEYYLLRPYDLVFLRPGLLHKTEYPIGTPKKRLVINFRFDTPSPALSTSFDRVMSILSTEIPIFRFPEAVRSSIISRLNEILTCEEQKQLFWDLSIHSKFLDFLCFVAACHKENIYQTEKLNSSALRIHEIAEFIHNQYYSELSLTCLADRFYMNPSHLSRQFKTVIGHTLVHYIQMTRINNAKQFLIYSDMTIANVADRCGFTSFSQFSRVFLQHCGISPSEFRSQWKVTHPAKKDVALPPASVKSEPAHMS